MKSAQKQEETTSNSTSNSPNPESLASSLLGLGYARTNGTWIRAKESDTQQTHGTTAAKKKKIHLPDTDVQVSASENDQESEEGDDVREDMGLIEAEAEVEKTSSLSCNESEVENENEPSGTMTYAHKLHSNTRLDTSSQNQSTTNQTKRRKLSQKSTSVSTGETQEKEKAEESGRNALNWDLVFGQLPSVPRVNRRDPNCELLYGVKRLLIAKEPVWELGPYQIREVYSGNIYTVKGDPYWGCSCLSTDISILQVDDNWWRCEYCSRMFTNY